MTRVIVLHLFTNFEDRGLIRSEDMADFSHGVKRPGDLNL